MKDFDVNQLLELLAQYEFELKIGGLIVIAVVVLWVIVSLLRKLMAHPAIAGNTPEFKPEVERTPPLRESDDQDSAPTRPIVVVPKEIPVELQKPKVAETLIQPVKQAPVVAAEIPKVSPKPATAKVPVPQIPQDSVLRRHYVSHARYMIETVSMPRPTESVLRRHYEQLIASQLDDCLTDSAKMERLIQRYDEHRKNAFAALAA